MTAATFVPLVEVFREGILESVHRGLVVVSDAAGGIRAAAGDPAARIITRSAAKPFQAAHLVASGVADALGVTDLEIAVAVGSHGGAPEHVAAVRALLERADLDEGALGCGTHPPFDRAARALARAHGASPLQNNCSGKHAAMLAGSKQAGRPLERYLEPGEPWQVAIREGLAEAAGLSAADVGTVTDGCGAPSYVLPAAGFARAWARLAADRDGPLARVRRAAASHPRMIAGVGRLETALMEMRAGGLIAKSGAEGVWAFAAQTADGPRGAVIKIADGDDRRARTAVAIALAARLADLEAGERRRLEDEFLPRVTTLSGRDVGEVRAVFPEPPGPGGASPGGAAAG